MDRSQDENRGRDSQSQPGIAGRKRTADEVSEMEVPESSRPMLSFDATRHRPNDPEVDLSSAVPPPSAAAAGSPQAQSSVRRLDSPRVPSQPTMSLSGIDRSCPVVQSMLREEFKEGRAEGMKENKRKLDEAESKVEELRRKASDDRLTFEAICKEKDQGIYDQQMAMARYQRELTARRRLIEDFRQQANKATPQDSISAQQIAAAEARFGALGQELATIKSQNELMRSQITHWQVQWGQTHAGLEKSKADLSTKAGQLGACQGQLDNAARGLNERQGQLDKAERELKESKEAAIQSSATSSAEIGSLKAANTTLIELMRTQSTHWQAQCGQTHADLEKSKADLSTQAGQLDACQAQLDDAARELRECQGQLDNSERELKGSKEAASQLLATSSEEIGSLKAANTKLIQDIAERAASVKALTEELGSSSKQVEDGKDGINALTSQNNELIKVRGDLEKKVAQQDEKLQQISAENIELTRKLEEIEEMDERASPIPNESQDHADDNQQVEEIADLPAGLAPVGAAADLELVRGMLERERANAEAEAARRDARITATLEAMEATERTGRQTLMDELEDKDAQLYDAQKQVKELTERLLAASPTQASQAPPSAPSSSSSSSSSPAPIPKPPPPTAATATSPPSQPNSSFRLPSPRRILIMIFTSLLLFLLIPFLHSLNRPAATENTNSGQVTFEALPVEDTIPTTTTSEAYEEYRWRRQAHAMANWDRTERMSRGEAPNKWDLEYRPIPGYP